MITRTEMGGLWGGGVQEFVFFSREVTSSSVNYIGIRTMWLYVAKKKYVAMDNARSPVQLPPPASRKASESEAVGSMVAGPRSGA